MRNKLIDLNNHLFMEIERLGDEDLNGESLQEEIGRAKAITSAATQVINNGRLMLDVIKAADDLPGAEKHPLLQSRNEE